MNSVVYSPETRIRKFREHHDQEIGRPYFGAIEEVCGRLQCERTTDGSLEITHEDVFEKGCVIVWVVEPSETGKYRHPTNGLVLDIVGTKKAWRYRSCPEKCLYGLSWSGPW